MGMGRKLLCKWVGMGWKVSVLDNWVGIGWKVGVEFAKTSTDFFKDCKEVRVLMEGEIRDLPGSVKDSSKDFGLEGLRAILDGYAEPHSAMSYV
jgi:hypothetical protein